MKQNQTTTGEQQSRVEAVRGLQTAAADCAAGMTRRALLRTAGLLLVAESLPELARAAIPQISSVMSTLSAYMAEAGGRALPENVSELTKQHVLDTFAAMISGSRLGPGQAALKFAAGYGGTGPCSIAASTLRQGAMEAAMTNGMLAHSDETDDSHSPSLSHPGCAVVPAAWAVGEQFAVDGPRLLRAVALGYDIGPRVTTTLGAIQYQAQSHRSSHAIAGAFGAAAAAGCCGSLNAPQMRWLLDYTAQQTSGIAAWQRDTEHIEKAFVFGGMPARAGVTSAIVVRSGWSGVSDILSGSDNFLAAFAPGTNPEGLIDQLGMRYEVQRTNIKKWSVGSPIQASLDALEILTRQYGIHAQQVATIRVRVAAQEASVVDNREMPDVCLQHLVAVMLMDGTVSFDAAHDVGRMSNPATLQQRAKVTLIPDKELDFLLPRREAIIEVKLTDGRSLVQRVEDVRGTAENPMTWDEVERKSRDLIAPVLGTAKTTQLLEKVHSLESCKDIREFRNVLQT